MDKSKVLTCLLTILMISSSLESKAGVISQALDSFNAGKFEDAVKYYEEAIAKSRSLPKNARLKLGLGASAFKANDYDKASRAFGEALLSKDLSVDYDNAFKIQWHEFLMNRSLTYGLFQERRF